MPGDSQEKNIEHWTDLNVKAGPAGAATIEEAQAISLISADMTQHNQLAEIIEGVNEEDTVNSEQD